MTQAHFVSSAPGGALQVAEAAEAGSQSELPSSFRLNGHPLRRLKRREHHNEGNLDGGRGVRWLELMDHPRLERVASRWRRSGFA